MYKGLSCVFSVIGCDLVMVECWVWHKERWVQVWSCQGWQILSWLHKRKSENYEKACINGKHLFSREIEEPKSPGTFAQSYIFEIGAEFQMVQSRWVVSFLIFFTCWTEGVRIFVSKLYPSWFLEYGWEKYSKSVGLVCVSVEGCWTLWMTSSYPSWTLGTRSWLWMFRNCVTSSCRCI